MTARYTLFINRNDSRCGSCSKGANPHDEAHDVAYGWEGPREGCGVRWTHVSSMYLGMKDAITSMRPDLEWAGPDD